MQPYAVAPGVVYADGRAYGRQSDNGCSMDLTDAAIVIGEILYVDGGAPFGHW